MSELLVKEGVSKLNNAAVTPEERKKQLDKEDELREKQKKNSPFSSWYQVNLANNQYFDSCLKENPTALRVLYFLIENMDNYNALICSMPTISEVLEISIPTVSRAVAYLKKNGFIITLKSGNTNVYVVNNSLVWKSWGSNAKFCKFPSNVLLSSNEQEEIMKAQIMKDRTPTITKPEKK